MADHVRTLLFAVLSRNGDRPLTLAQLEAEYKELEGKFIPAEELGYANALSLLQSMDNVHVFQTNGRTFVKAEDCADTRHVVQLINAQKKNPVKQSPWTIPRNVEDNILTIIAVSPNECLMLSQLMSQYIHFYQTKLPAPRGHLLAWLATATKFVVTNDTGKSHVLQPIPDVDVKPFRFMGQRLQAQMSRIQHRPPPQSTVAPRIMPARLQRKKTDWPITPRLPSVDQNTTEPEKELTIAIQKPIDNKTVTLSPPAAKKEVDKEPKTTVPSFDKAFYTDASTEDGNSCPPLAPSVQNEPSDPPTKPQRPYMVRPACFEHARLETEENREQLHNRQLPKTSRPESTCFSTNPLASVPSSCNITVTLPTSTQPLNASCDFSRRTSSLVANTVRREVVRAVSLNERLGRLKLDSSAEGSMESKGDLTDEASVSIEQTQMWPINPLDSAETSIIKEWQNHSQPPAVISSKPSDNVLPSVPNDLVASTSTGTQPDTLPQWIVDWAIKSKVALSSTHLAQQINPTRCLIGTTSDPDGGAVVEQVESVLSSTPASLINLVTSLSLSSTSSTVSKPANVSSDPPSLVFRVDCTEQVAHEEDARPVKQMLNVPLAQVEKGQLEQVAHEEDARPVKQMLDVPLAQVEKGQLVLSHSNKPVQEILGLSLEKFLNLVSLLRENPPVPETLIADLYWAAYNEELFSKDSCDELIKSLIDQGVLVIELGATVTIAAHMLPAAGYLMRVKLKQDVLLHLEKAYGKVEGSDSFGFKLIPIRKCVDVSALIRVNDEVLQDQPYICVKQNQQDVVVAIQRVSSPAATGCFWQVRTEAGAYKIVHEKFLFKLEGSGIVAPADPLNAWAAGKRPANGDTVSVKILKRTANGLAICCLAGEQLYSVYVLRNPPSTSLIPVSVLRWGGQSYLLDFSATALGVETQGRIPLRCMKYADVLIEFIGRHGISPNSYVVSVLDVIEVLAQRGVDEGLITDLIRV
ncbi:uncharacterized protein LOC111244181 isoform X2 [Varroa destructor]|nr:uncharacterized protein LOC111244181 isoform X2 [Varroa destructor]XP_022646699.1 uncharacterized protein LOC111244181 isoform X2 [Varroa destructor]